jgi:hypothetical protein
MAKRTVKKKEKTRQTKTSSGKSRSSSRPNQRGSDGQTFWDRQARKIQGGSSTFRKEIWKPQKGTNLIRLFSFMPENSSYEEGGPLLTIRNDTHWYEGPDGRRPVLCLGGAPFPKKATCPICQSRTQFPEDVWDGVKGQSGIRANTTYLMNVWPYDESELKVGQFAKSIMEGRRTLGKKGLFDVVQEFMADGRGYDPLDLKKGRDFTLKRGGTGFQTIYTVSIGRKATVFKPKVQPFDLFDFITIPTEEEVQEICDMLLDKYSAKR